MVRPESVRLTPASEGDPGLVGTVIKISFLGSVTRASVHCPAVDAPFIVDMPSGFDHGIRENSLVQLQWDVKDTVLLDVRPDDSNEGTREEVAQHMDRNMITRRDALRAGAVGVGALAMAGRVGDGGRRERDATLR